MNPRDDYPPGVPCWIDTAQPDQDAAMRFYGGVFAWEFEDRMPAGAAHRYFVATLDGRDVAGIGAKYDDTPIGWSTYIAVDSADATAAAARDAGGTVLAEPFEIPPDAGRMAVLADPAGAVFCTWEAGARKGAQLVNAAGTWNWSNLETPDPEGAKAFYGAVFGWEAAALEIGTMWRVPGYGDLLAASDPELRRRHAEPWVPAGFSDAVGWMLDGDRPRWSVTFAIDDVDGAAATAAELGGAVVAPPFDAGPARIAVLSDPAGATFTVSRYDPG